MFFNWHAYPFVRLLLPFAGGIILHQAVPFSMGFFFLFPAAFLAVILWSIPDKMHAYRRRIFGCILNGCLFLLGPAILSLRSKAELPEISGFGYVIAEVRQEPVAGLRSYKMTVEILEAISGEKHISINKGAIVYSPLTFHHTRLLYGDVLILPGTWERVPGPANPRQFDYSRYLAGQDVFYQSYIERDRIGVLDTTPSFSLSRWIHTVRRSLVNKLRDLSLDGQELAVASALLIGYRDELDPEIKTSFSRVGAMHILSVSGLHVGIVFVMIGKLLFFLKKTGWQRWLKFLTILAFLWFYAFLSGFSPSVLRATVMFSFLLPGTIWNLSSNTYNTIALSAFFLLLTEPLLLFDIGFQLSYLAVLGIIYLYGRMRYWWIPRNAALRWLWSATAVSLAAQAFTTPLTLYYFGQFPNYFLPANLLIVPLSGFVIYAGVAALAFSWVPYLAPLLGMALKYSVLLMNRIIRIIEHLPYSYADNLPLDVPRTLVLCLFMAAGILFFESHRPRYLKLALLMVAVFLALTGFRQFTLLRQQYFVIYSLRKTGYMEMIDGKTVYASDTLPESLYMQSVRPFHKHRGLQRGAVPSAGKAYHRGPVHSLGGRSVFVYDNLAAQYDYHDPLHVNYLWVTGRGKRDRASLLSCLSPDVVILDPRLSRRNEDHWIRVCDSLGQPCHSIRNDGAFVQNW